MGISRITTLTFSNKFMMCGSGKKCGVSSVAWWLLVIGGLNWGLVGLGGFMMGNWNVVNMLLGSWPQVEWIVYILVGLSTLLLLWGCKCKTCAVDTK